MNLRLFVLSSAAAFGLLSGGLGAQTTFSPGAQPQLAVAASGRLWLAYGQLEAAPAPGASDHAAGSGHAAHAPAGARPDGDVMVAYSDDGGATFSAGRKAAHVPGLMLGMRRGPRLAVHGDTLTITAIGKELVALRSTDAGRTWSEAVTVNDVPGAAREGLHDLASAPDGRLFVTWLDLRNGKTEIWAAESSDGGRTWGGNEQVYRSPDKSVCECCHPSALFDDDGNLAVMWRNSIEGARDLWMTTRAKGATAFAAAHKLGEGTWKLNACPMDGGCIVALGGGRFGAVWQRAGEVFFTPPVGPEVQVGKGKQPVVVARGAETLIVWQQDANLVLVRKPGDVPTQLARDARFATARPLPDGKGVVVAYEQGPAKEKQPGVVVVRL